MQMELGLASETITARNLWDCEIIPSFTGSFSLSYSLNKRVKRYKLHVAEDRQVRVVVPSSDCIPEASEYAHKNLRQIELKYWKSYIENLNRNSWVAGTSLYLKGQLVLLEEIFEGNKRFIQMGSYKIPVARNRQNLRKPLELHLRRIAREELILRACALAAEHRIEVFETGIRRYAHQWAYAWKTGKKLFLDWRLIQMPEHVTDFIILSHLLQMGLKRDSDLYWKRLEKACPSYKTALDWLSTCGPSLR